MSYTHSYVDQTIVFAFLESNVFVTPLTRLLKPLHEFVWISVLLLISVSVLIILLTKKLPPRQRHFIIGGRMNRTPILNMLSSLIGNSLGNPRMAQSVYFGTFARTLAMLWILFWLIVRNAYQGALYEHFESQRIKSLYDSIEKIENAYIRINTPRPSVAFLSENINRER